VISEKQIAIVTKDSLEFQTKSTENNRTISSLLQRYDRTRLTENEKIVFEKLKADLEELKQLEQDFFISKQLGEDVVLEATKEVTSHLKDLSKIQLKEGKRQVSIGKQAIDTIDLFTQWEIIFLVVMGILIQIIILYKPKAG
jgi:hypothetical protein